MTTQKATNDDPKGYQWQCKKLRMTTENTANRYEIQQQTAFKHGKTASPYSKSTKTTEKPALQSYCKIVSAKIIKGAA